MVKRRILSDKLVSLNFDNKTQSDKIISCSVGNYYDSDLGQRVDEFNDDGPVYGPNGELELDPDNQQCFPPSSELDADRVVFATCKNNCPGGELMWSLLVDCKPNVSLLLAQSEI